MTVILSFGPPCAVGETTTVILKAIVVSYGLKDLGTSRHQILRPTARRSRLRMTFAQGDDSSETPREA